MHGSLLSAGDLARLRAACGRETVDPARSLFGPESVTWRVNREAVLLLGGGRALLLQVAHPLVAAGVAAHSEFRAHPLRRLWRTLDLMLTLAFADGATALGAVRTIEGVHARVHGVLEAPSGPFPRGTHYDANDPALLLWVYATLVDTALVVYERFVEPLGVDAPHVRALPGICGRHDPRRHARGRPGRPGDRRLEEKARRALVTVARRLLPFVPRRVRLMPHARRAGVAHGGGPPLGSAAG